MRTTQYVRQLKAIEAADTGGIRERWLFGLRLLRDPEVMTASGKSLRHGVTDQLIAAAGINAKGRKRLSDQEIQRCLRCARAYPTEAQIRLATTDFDSWSEIVAAGFPAYEAPEDEPPADHRTEAERDRDHARAVTDILGDQAALFPLSDFEPVVTPLKVLAEYADEMEEWTGRHVERDRKRRVYLEALIAAAGGDLSVSWKVAHDALGTGPTQPAPRPLPNPGPPPAPVFAGIRPGGPEDPMPHPPPEPPPNPRPPLRGAGHYPPLPDSPPEPPRPGPPPPR